MKTSAKNQPDPLQLPALPDHLSHLSGQDRVEAAWLHIQASEWYESQGNTRLAIQHALAGRAWPRAAYLIDRSADDLLGNEKTEELLAYLGRLPAETMSSWPRLGIVQGQLNVLAGELNQAQMILDEIGGRLALPEARAGLHLPPGDPPGSGLDELIGVLQTVRSGLSLQKGQLELAYMQAGVALARLPLACQTWRALAAHSAGQALARSAKLEQASDYFARARQSAGLAGSQSLEMRSGLEQVLCQQRSGQLRAALELCEALLSRLLEGDMHADKAASRAYAIWAELLASGGRQEESLAAAVQANQLAARSGHGRAEAVLALARVHQARREYAVAEEILASEQRWLASQSLEANCLRIDIYLCAGRTGKVLEMFQDLGLGPAREMQAEPIELRRLAARLLLAQGLAGQALEGLQALHREEQCCGRELSGVETLVLLALAYQVLDDEQASLDALAQALFLAAPQDWMLPFLIHGPELTRVMNRLLYRAAAQGIQPEFISQLLDRIPPL